MAPPPALLFSDNKASGWFFMAERAQESFVYVIEPKKRNRTVRMETREDAKRSSRDSLQRVDVLSDQDI